MSMASPVLFTLVGGLFLLSTLLAFVTMGRLVLSGRAGLLGDGLDAGRPAPRWSAVDQRGHRHEVPSGDRWQMLVFSDHSLSAFPAVVEGIGWMAGQRGAPEVVLVAGEAGARRAVQALPRLGLDIPVVAVPLRMYHRYNVRVLPWVFFVDPGGTVWGSSLVNAQWQLERLWTIARLRATERTPVQLDGHVGGVA
jgi:hypothetical protein